VSVCRGDYCIPQRDKTVTNGYDFDHLKAKSSLMPTNVRFARNAELQQNPEILISTQLNIKFDRVDCAVAIR
jgi:hypothetical protein